MVSNLPLRDYYLQRVALTAFLEIITCETLWTEDGHSPNQYVDRAALPGKKLHAAGRVHAVGRRVHRRAAPCGPVRGPSGRRVHRRVTPCGAVWRRVLPCAPCAVCRAPCAPPCGAV
eukprot:gene9488-biopygen3420